MHLSDKEASNLRMFLNVLLYHTQEAMKEAQDIQEIDTYDERCETLSMWITRLSERQVASTEDTAQRRSQGALDGWDVRRGKQGGN